MHLTRKAGALSPLTCRVGVLIALLLTVATGAVHAAGLRLLHANPTAVRQSPLPGRDADGATLRLQFDAGGRSHALRLRPNVELEASLDLREPAAEAFQGKVEEYPNSWAALTRVGEGWTGIWYDGAEYFGVDAAEAVAAGTGSVLVLYRLNDVVWDEEEPSLEEDVSLAPEGGAPSGKLALPLAVLPPDTPPRKRLAIGVVADALLARRAGEDLQDNLLAQLNIIDGIFSYQLGVHVVAASVTVFEEGQEPLGRTTDAEDLLDELSAWRASSLIQRQAGLTHLFTGRDLNGRTVGMAFLDTLCSRSYSASLSQSTGPVGFTALVAAHEIAHVFGAPHDGDSARACAAAPAGYLMSPRISGSQEFSTCSLEQMAPQVEAASCLTKLPASGEWDQPTEPGSQGGSGRLGAGSLGVLGMLAAAMLWRRRAQMRANQSAR